MSWSGPKRVSGVGIGLRRELWPALSSIKASFAHSPDWLEFITENHVENRGWRQRMLDGARERWPLVPHGVSVSVGGPDPLDLEYLKALKRLLDSVGAEYYSDHLCWTGGHGFQFHDLIPLPFSAAAVEWTVPRVRLLSEVLERPIVLENITYYAEMPGSRLSEAAFIGQILEESGAYLLLDVNNAYQNAMNHGRDPVALLEALPLEFTRQIHLAGFEQDPEGVLLDNHGSAVDDAVWQLYEHALQFVGDVPTLIEWDNNIPALDVVLEQADRAKTIRERSLGRAAESPTRGASHA